MKDQPNVALKWSWMSFKYFRDKTVTETAMRVDVCCVCVPVFVCVMAYVCVCVCASGWMWNVWALLYATVFFFLRLVFAGCHDVVVVANKTYSAELLIFCGA